MTSSSNDLPSQEMIERKINQENYITAIEMCDKLINARNNDWYIFALRGAAFSKIKNFRSALADFDTALAMGGQLPNVYYFRARAHSDNGEFSEAIADYSESIKIDPKADAYFSRGIVKQKLGLAKDALQDFLRASEMDPYFPDVSYIIGLSYLKFNEYSMAENWITKALAVDSKNAEGWYNLGIAQNAQGHLTDSVQSYTTCIENQPDYFEAIFNRGLIFKKLGDIQHFKLDMENIAAHSPDKNLAKDARDYLFSLA